MIKYERNLIESIKVFKTKAAKMDWKCWKLSGRGEDTIYVFKKKEGCSFFIIIILL